MAFLKNSSFFTCLIIVLAILLCSCEEEPTQPPQTSSTTATTEQPVTEPISTAMPSEPEPTGQYANIPYDLMPYVEEAILQHRPLHDFQLMFGSDSIRYTENTAYTVVEMTDGKKMFVFFDVSNSVYDTVIMSEFPKDEAFLDFILGQRVTVYEMLTFTSNYLWMFSSRPVMALYTQQGYYMLEFGYEQHTFGEKVLYLCRICKYVANDEADSWTIFEEDK